VWLFRTWLENRIKISPQNRRAGGAQYELK
jgi:hypothetical protein